jgi:hypothetical protein
MSTKTAPRRALITGASSGIGYELAKLFAADGWSLVLAARGEDKLKALADELRSRHNIAVEVVPIDLSQPGAAEKLFAAATAGGQPITGLVNNAGFGLYGPYASNDVTQIEDLIQVNVASLAALTRLALPEMVIRRGGYILNVASAAGFQPGPLMAVYFASKAFVLHLSEAIAEEMAAAGIHVTALCPGPVHTDFARRASMEDVQMFKGSILRAEDVARDGYRGLMRGKRIVIPGVKYKVLLFAGRFAPRALLTKIAMRMQSRG